MAQLKEITLEGMAQERTTKLKAVDREGIKLGQEMEEGVTSYRQNLQNILATGQDQAQARTRLDAAIAHGNEFKTNIAELTAGLTREFQAIGEIFQTAQDYTTFTEKFWNALGFQRMAQKAQLNRVMRQDVTQNLEELIKYGILMSTRVGEHVIAQSKSEGLMEQTIRDTDKIMREAEEQYEAWKGRHAEMRDQLTTLEEQMQGLAESEYAAKLAPHTDLKKQVAKAKEQEDLYFTQYERAKQARPAQMRQLEAIRDIRGALMRFKIQIEADIKHVTNIYRTTPQNIKSALATKAAVVYDQSKNLATEAAVTASVIAADAIMDATASRAERQLIDPEKLEELTAYLRAKEADFQTRMGKLKEAAGAYRPA